MADYSCKGSGFVQQTLSIAALTKSNPIRRAGFVPSRSRFPMPDQQLTFSSGHQQFSCRQIFTGFEPA
jgi:hypothetical protein